MSCIIKNLPPPPPFGIVGNRGAAFPLSENSPYISTPVIDFYFLAREEDNQVPYTWAIYTQYDKQIAIEGLSAVDVLLPDRT